MKGFSFSDEGRGDGRTVADIDEKNQGEVGVADTAFFKKMNIFIE